MCVSQPSSKPSAAQLISGTASSTASAQPNADWNAYLKANPDVAAEATKQGVDPVQYAAYHYGTYGQSEGRALPTLVVATKDTAITSLPTLPAQPQAAAQVQPGIAAAKRSYDLDPEQRRKKLIAGVVTSNAGITSSASTAKQSLLAG